MTHRFLSLTTIEKFVPLMKEEGVSIVARSPSGFLNAYRACGGHASRLSDTWIKKRDGFIARHMAQLIANDEPLYRGDGVPTRRHLALIAWAFSPAENVAQVARKLN